MTVRTALNYMNKDMMRKVWPTMKRIRSGGVVYSKEEAHKATGENSEDSNEVDAGIKGIAG